MNQTGDQEDANCDWSTGEASGWMYAIQSFIASIIILENLVMMIVITHNWFNLTRQHNMYRYLISLVTADLLYGTILLVHGILTVVAAVDGQSLVTNYLKDLANNIIIGVLHGSCFASLASASLLNTVIRTTYTRALERAAGIEAEQPRQIAFLRLPSLRSPKTTRVLIGFIWVLTLTFILTPLKIHCHEHITRCDTGKGYYSIKQGSKSIGTSQSSSLSVHQEEHGGIDCSFLRPPNGRTYVLVLNFCITISWVIMLICNMMTVFMKATVEKSVHVVRGDTVLKIRHKAGFTWDSSSLLAAIITISMTVSTLPYVIFSFTTEGGRFEERLQYAKFLSPDVVVGLEMTRCISSLLNPCIYTAMLEKLRSDITRFFAIFHKKWSILKSTCFGSRTGNRRSAVIRESQMRGEDIQDAEKMNCKAPHETPILVDAELCPGSEMV